MHARVGLGRHHVAKSAVDGPHPKSLGHFLVFRGVVVVLVEVAVLLLAIAVAEVSITIGVYLVEPLCHSNGSHE